MFEGLYFEFPKFALIVIFFLICANFCKMKIPSIYFPHTGQFLKQSVSASKLLLFLKWLGIIMLILAFMSPVKDEPYELEPKDGYEIALILDASQSMKAQGFDRDDSSLTRFDAVKSIVKDFVKERKNWECKPDLIADNLLEIAKLI